MGGQAPQRKGKRGELEVAALAAQFGITLHRTPNSGGLLTKGDLFGLDSYYIEVKRRQSWSLPAWLKKAYLEAEGLLPLVFFRRDVEPGERKNPCGRWHVVLPAEELFALLEHVKIGRWGKDV